MEAAATPRPPQSSSPLAHAPSNIQLNAVPAESTQNIQLTPEQLSKLQNELDVVQANMAVLNEMLNELTPREEHPSDLELLTVCTGTTLFHTSTICTYSSYNLYLTLKFF